MQKLLRGHRCAFVSLGVDGVMVLRERPAGVSARENHESRDLFENESITNQGIVLAYVQEKRMKKIGNHVCYSTLCCKLPRSFESFLKGETFFERKFLFRFALDSFREI